MMFRIVSLKLSDSKITKEAAHFRVNLCTINGQSKQPTCHTFREFYCVLFVVSVALVGRFGIKGNCFTACQLSMLNLLLRLGIYSMPKYEMAAK